MNKLSIQTTIMLYMGFSAALLVFALGVFVVFNHTKTLENDLVSRMHIMVDDIMEHKLYSESPQSLKNYFMSNESYHKDSYGDYVKQIEFKYKKTIIDNQQRLSVIERLPNNEYLVLESSSKHIEEQVHSLLLRLGISLLVILGLIMYGLYILLRKLLYPLNCLVDYCNNATSKDLELQECIGSYEVDSLKDAIHTLEASNHILCKEKQDIFKEAAHEIKTPIAILKARLSLFDKSDMSKKEFIQESSVDLSTISNKLRELIFLKAIEWDIRQAKESVQMQNQCSMMQQLFRPILEKKNIEMISNLQEDFSLYIHKEAIGRVMQAVFENIFMNTKNGTTIHTYIDPEENSLSIVNEIGEGSDEILFSSHIGSKLIQRLSDKLDYEYDAYEKDGLFYTTIIFKGKKPSL